MIEILYYTVFVWGPPVAKAFMFCGAVYLCTQSFVHGYPPRAHSYRFLIGMSVFGYTLYAAVGVWLQYYAWSQTKFTAFLLHLPITQQVLLPSSVHRAIFGSRFGYFLFYSWGHFVLSVLLTFAIAFSWYVFLTIIQKYRSRFFREGEVLLGTFLALVVGWPGELVFIVLCMALVVVISAVRGALFGKVYTTMTLPFVCAAAVTLLFSSTLINILGIAVLRI